MEETPRHSDADALALAYEERTRELHDARAALSGAISALTVELSRLREQHDLAHADIRNLREHEAALLARVAALEAELEVMRNMRVVRWTAPLRARMPRLRRRSR